MDRKTPHETFNSTRRTRFSSVAHTFALVGDIVLVLVARACPRASQRDARRRASRSSTRRDATRRDVSLHARRPRSKRANRRSRAARVPNSVPRARAHLGGARRARGRRSRLARRRHGDVVRGTERTRSRWYVDIHGLVQIWLEYSESLRRGVKHRRCVSTMSNEISILKMLRRRIRSRAHGRVRRVLRSDVRRGSAARSGRQRARAVGGMRERRRREIDHGDGD